MWQQNSQHLKESCEVQVDIQLSSCLWDNKMELEKWIMLEYTDFTKPFESYTDASKLEVG